MQFFSLLQSNDNALKILVDIVGVAPRLSAWLSRNAQLVDILIETRPTNDDGDGFEADEVDFADILDALRLDVHHSQFRTGVFLLANPTNYQATGIQFADIARRSISRLCRPPSAILPRVTETLNRWKWLLSAWASWAVAR